MQTIDLSCSLYSFGMQMPSRSNTYGNSDVDYRYAFQGMEQDNEVSGNGNSYTTEFRQYDPRLGRWKSLDPLMAQFPWMSPYVAFDNNPIYYTDVYGLSSDGPGDPPQGYTCEDESGEIRVHQGEGEWGSIEESLDANKNGLIILFEPLPGQDSEYQKRANATENDNSNAENENYQTLMLEEVTVAFKVAKKYSEDRKDIRNVIVFRQHGNKGSWYFPIGNDDIINISKQQYNYYTSDFSSESEGPKSFEDLQMSQSPQSEFFNQLKNGDFNFDNGNTTLIFTNCKSGAGDEGKELGDLFSELIGVGELFMNLDSSPFTESTNLNMPLTMPNADQAKGWVVYQMINLNGFIYYDRIETGKSIQLNSSGPLMSKPKL